jgi:hypothetical protein
MGSLNKVTICDYQPQKVSDSKDLCALTNSL